MSTAFARAPQLEQLITLVRDLDTKQREIQGIEDRIARLAQLKSIHPANDSKRTLVRKHQSTLKMEVEDAEIQKKILEMIRKRPVTMTDICKHDDIGMHKASILSGRIIPDMKKNLLIEEYKCIVINSVGKRMPRRVWGEPGRSVVDGGHYSK